MAEHSPDNNNLDFIAPDGSYQEKHLDYLAAINNGLGGVDNPTSTANSTTSILTAGSTFTGTGELNTASDVLVVVATDQEGTLYMEFSTDGTNWDSSLSFKYDPSRINPPHVLVKGNRYYRTRFTNTSASDQTYLRLATYYGSFQKLTAPINGTLAENYDAVVTRPTDYNSEVAMGKRQGRATINKFGYNADVDSAASEIVASFGGTFNIMTTADTLNIVSDSANDTSAGTGARTLLITGIGSDFLNQTETVTMNGATPVTTSNTWLGINRVIVLSSGTNNANVGTITISDTAGTVGTQAELAPNSSVTQQAIYHTQINHNLLLDWLWVNIRKLSGGSAPRVTVRGYSYSRVTDTAYEIFDYDVDTSVDNTVSLNPSQPFVVGGREVIYFVAETNTNDTSVRLRFSGIEERIN